MKAFYEHLIEINFLLVELDTLDLSDNEKNELKHHVHSSIHYVALDVVLSELTPEHKKTFIEHLNSGNHTELWKHLLVNTENIEEKIKEKIHKTAHEFREERSKLQKKT